MRFLSDRRLHVGEHRFEIFFVLDFVFQDLNPNAEQP